MTSKPLLRFSFGGKKQSPEGAGQEPATPVAPPSGNTASSTKAPAAGSRQVEPSENSTMTKPNESQADADSHQMPREDMTILSKNMFMKSGDVDSDEDFTVMGRFEGTLRCRQLIVTSTGSVKGLVVAKEVRVSGEIDGEISADLLLVFETARVNGVIDAKQMGMKPGASVTATLDCRLQNTLDKPAQAAPAAAANSGGQRSAKQGNAPDGFGGDFAMTAEGGRR